MTIKRSSLIHLLLTFILVVPCAGSVTGPRITAGTHNHLSDTTPPVVEIHTPANEATITAPADVIATVSDDNLVSWRLLYQERGSNDAAELASGDTPMASASLAQFDPTLLLNGFYTLALEAIDAGGNVTQTAVVLGHLGQACVIALMVIRVYTPQNG